MSQEPQQTERGSSCLRLRAPPGRRFLTNPESDLLGLAEEIYYARTGLLDYKDVLARQENLTQPRGTVYDGDHHPFLHCFTEQNRYNALVDKARIDTGQLKLYRNCRHRWHNRLGALLGTKPCMRPFCPACWVHKIESAYEALADARAPVIGVLSTNNLLLHPDDRDPLTAAALRSVLSPARQVWAGRRDAAWHPLFWALFALPGAEHPAYQITGLYVAREPVVVTQQWVQDPGDAELHGVPRELETVKGNALTVWERAFTGELRSEQAWDAFRRVTPAPVISSSENGTSLLYTDGDAIRWEAEAIQWPRLTRTQHANRTIFAEGAPPDLGILNPCLDLAVREEIYGDVRSARDQYLKRLKMIKESEERAQADRANNGP